MNRSRRDAARDGRRYGEIALFIGASILGIYGLGQGLTGLFEPGRGIDLLWLAITGLAMFVLFAHMGRVHDTWPRCPEAAPEETAGGPAPTEPDATK